MRRFSSALYLTVFLALPSVSFAQAKEISLWHTFTQPARVAGMRKMADEFEAHSGVKVNIEVQTWGGMSKKWPIALAAGTLPDIVTATGPDMLGMWSVGALAPMNNVIDALGGPDAFLAYLDYWQQDGQYIAYPLYGMSRLLTYRKSVLKEAGITKVPDTWPEFLEAVEKTTKPPNRWGFVHPLNKSDPGETHLMYALVYQLGGQFWDADLNPTLDTPQFKQAVKFLIDLYNVGHPPESLNYTISDMFRIWESGLTVFSFEGMPVQIGAHENARAVFDDTGVALLPMPTEPGAKRTNYTAPRLMALVNKPQATLEVAEQFMIFINQHERKLEFLHTNPFMMPVLKKIAEDPKFIDGSEMLSAMKDNVMLTYEGMQLGITGSMEHGYNPFAFLLEQDTIEPMFHRIIVDGVSIDEAAKEAQESLAKRVSEFKQLIAWKN